MADEQLGWILAEIRKQNQQLAEMRKELQASVEKIARAMLTAAQTREKPAGRGKG